MIVIAVTLMATPAAITIADETSPAHLLTEEKMEEAIAAYEAILPGLDTLTVQSQAFVFDRLCQLHYENSTFYEPGSLEKKEILSQGRKYGFSSLRLNPNFEEWEHEDFIRAISFVTDKAALLWTAHNWGEWFSYSALEAMASVDKLAALYERCIEIDETYYGGFAHQALGALLVATPALFGGDLERGRWHLERAIELDTAFLRNHLIYAQYWGFTHDFFGAINGIRDRVLLEHELTLVIDGPIGDWPFWNREAKQEAQRLLAEMQTYLP